MIDIMDMQESVRYPAIASEIEPVGDLCLAAIAYAAFFTESERDEIGSFEELPAPERARWESVAAHIARTVVSPIDEDLDAWRAEQRTVLEEQVRDAPYSQELWRAMTRTNDLQQRVASLREMVAASRASIATARSHSQRLATSAQALERPIWWDHPVPGYREPRVDGVVPEGDGNSTPPGPPAGSSLDGTGHRADRVIRRV